MKRGLLRTLIFTFLSVLLLTTAFAEEEIFRIPELGLEVAIPSEFYVITRETPDDDPVFDALGLTKPELMDHFEANVIYLNAFPADSYEELVVTMSEGSMTDFNQLGDAALKTFASSFEELYAEYNADITSYEIYQHAQAKFIKLYYTDTANAVWGLQYYTTYNTKAINFTLHSYEGEVTAEQEARIKAIVDSIHFDTEPVLPDTGNETEPFLYTSSDTGLCFTVPANWEEVPLSEEREYVEVQFSSVKNPGTAMSYGNMDLWEELPPEDRYGYTREDVNQSILSKSTISQFLDISDDELSLVEYNGIPYYQVTTNYEGDLFGMSITAEITQLLHVENGWIHMFQFFGTPEDAGYEGFESLLNSVVYPFSAKTEAEPSLYTDPDSGVTFTIPVDWAMDEAEEEFSFVTFISTKYPENYIFFWGSDLWEEQTQEEKAEYSRSEINNDQLTIADVAHICDVTEEEVSLVRYGENEYFYVKTENEDQWGPYTTIELIYFENGWMYEFQFDGTEEDPGYADFEKLLNSVKYPKPSRSDKAASPLKILVIVLAVVVVIGIVGFTVGLTAEHRKSSKKTTANHAVAQICQNCGHCLPGDSLFCHYCGTRIDKEDLL